MYRTGLVILILIFGSGSESITNQTEATPANPDKLARSYGYSAEAHEITTPDGYLLTTFRILNSTILNQNYDPFVLQHGLSSNAGQWVALGPERSLAFILANNGYDVWLSNARGSMHSRKHKTLSPDSPEFWDFSWHERGFYDMPSTIDYILNTTGHKQLFYVGHSEGGTVLYVMNSMKPEYNRKIRHAFAMAPAGFMTNSFSAAFIPRALTPGALRSIEITGRTIFNNRYTTDHVIIQFTKFGLCKLLAYICGQTVNALSGFNPRADVIAMTPGFTFFPDFVSVGEIVHYGQQFELPFSFRMYDYHEGNIVKYKSAEPPLYPIQKITTPITFMYSRNDRVVGVRDVEQFKKDIPNGHLYLVPDPFFNHLDFALNPHAKDIIYEPLLKVAYGYKKK